MARHRIQRILRTLANRGPAAPGNEFFCRRRKLRLRPGTKSLTPRPDFPVDRSWASDA